MSVAAVAALNALGESVSCEAVPELMRGIFHAPGVSGEISRGDRRQGGGPGVDYTLPRLEVLDGHATLLPVDAVIQCRGRAWTVVSPVPDGEGMTVLHLVEYRSPATSATPWRG